MKTIRIYQPGPYSVGETITLSSAASQHVSTVLRMQPGESITLFRGDNQEFCGTITEIQKKLVLVRIETNTPITRESPKNIHLAQAISKGDRMEWVVQKAVELGVTSITPLLTSRCVVRLNAERLHKKQAQWQTIAIAACEQSGRNQIPTIEATRTLEQYIEHCQAGSKLVLHPRASQSLRTLNLAHNDIALLIGPEGGFSDAEINLANANGFQSWILGPRTLRTETATIAALSVLQATVGDF